MNWISKLNNSFINNFLKISSTPFGDSLKIIFRNMVEYHTVHLGSAYSFKYVETLRVQWTWSILMYVSLPNNQYSPYTYLGVDGTPPGICIGTRLNREVKIGPWYPTPRGRLNNHRKTRFTIYKHHYCVRQTLLARMEAAHNIWGGFLQNGYIIHKPTSPCRKRTR